MGCLETARAKPEIEWSGSGIETNGWACGRVLYSLSSSDAKTERKSRMVLAVHFEKTVILNVSFASNSRFYFWSLDFSSFDTLHFYMSAIHPAFPFYLYLSSSFSSSSFVRWLLSLCLSIYCRRIFALATCNNASLTTYTFIHTHTHTRF